MMYRVPRHGSMTVSYTHLPSKEILPYEMRNKLQKTFYIVTPIYYQKICYGYCVSDGSVFALKSELAYLWTVNIGMALENIRKWKWINQMNEKKMCIRDRPISCVNILEKIK